MTVSIYYPLSYVFFFFFFLFQQAISHLAFSLPKTNSPHVSRNLHPPRAFSNSACSIGDAAAAAAARGLLIFAVAPPNEDAIDDELFRDADSFFTHHISYADSLNVKRAQTL